MSDNQDDEWVKELKSLPIFNMSLSSKELFHTNFIAWIIETNPNQMGKFFSEVLKLDETQTINKDTVQREKKNIDLSFVLGNTLVLIENKVKSIAYKEQLDKYSIYEIKEFTSKKIPIEVKKINYILLSLKKPTFFQKDEYNEYEYYETKNKNNQCVKWIYVSYENLIENALKLLFNENEYYKSLINDYIKFIEILNTNIMKEIDEISIVNLYKKDFNENNMLKTLTDLRMHDFFQKGVFENLAHNVHIKLQKKYINDVQIHLGKELENKPSNYIVIGHGMTRAVGLLYIFFRYNDNTVIGIQIQGNQYRKFIEGNDEENIFSEATRLKNSLFSFPGILNDNDIAPSKVNNKLKILSENKGINEVNLDFNKYHTEKTNHLFLYKYVTLDKMLNGREKNEELIDLICHDIEYMIQKIKE